MFHDEQHFVQVEPVILNDQTKYFDHQQATAPLAMDCDSGRCGHQSLKV